MKRGWVITACVVVGLIVGMPYALRLMDGPMGPIPGGTLNQGPMVNAANIDWLEATDGALIQNSNEPFFVELELVTTGSSRTTGIMLSDGALYVPCDLGFSWGRFDGLGWFILRAIHQVKRWHTQVQDGDPVVLRMGERRYSMQAFRVTDREHLQRLKSEFEALVAQLVAPEPLGERPTSGPRDIWFFRLQPQS